MELKPCPFCGGAAELDRSTDIRKAKKTEVFRVECSECYVRDNYWHSSSRAAARAWNTRAERTCHTIPYNSQAEEYADSWKISAVCSECGWTLETKKGDKVRMHDPYCGGCGAKVVE